MTPFSLHLLSPILKGQRLLTREPSSLSSPIHCRRISVVCYLRQSAFCMQGKSRGRKEFLAGGEAFEELFEGLRLGIFGESV